MGLHQMKRFNDYSKMRKEGSLGYEIHREDIKNTQLKRTFIELSNYRIIELT